MPHHVGRQRAEMGDEIEVGPIQAGQTEGIPAYPDDEIRLVRTLLAEASQACGTGKIAVANADLARDRRAALDRLGAVLVGQLQVREAAAPEVVDRMQPPTGRDLLDKVAKSAVGFVHTIARNALRRRPMAGRMVNLLSRSGRARPAKDGVHDGQVMPGTPTPQS